MSRLLFRVADSFEIIGRGLVLVPGIVPRGDETFRVGDSLDLRRPNGTTLRTQIAGLEFVNPAPADHAVAILLPNDFCKRDAPPDTEVWSTD